MLIQTQQLEKIVETSEGPLQILQQLTSQSMLARLLRLLERPAQVNQRYYHYSLG